METETPERRGLLSLPRHVLLHFRTGVLSKHSNICNKQLYLQPLLTHDGPMSVFQQSNHIAIRWNSGKSPSKMEDVDATPSIFLLAAWTADVVAVVGQTVTVG